MYQNEEINYYLAVVLVKFSILKLPFVCFFIDGFSYTKNKNRSTCDQSEIIDKYTNK